MQSNTKEKQRAASPILMDIARLRDLQLYHTYLFQIALRVAHYRHRQGPAQTRPHVILRPGSRINNAAYCTYEVEPGVNVWQHAPEAPTHRNGFQAPVAVTSCLSHHRSLLVSPRNFPHCLLARFLPWGPHLEADPTLLFVYQCSTQLQQ